MFSSTRSALSLRNLFAGYHEPTGLSKQQSQKLLDGLKTSFRQELDREYGRPSGRPTASARTVEADNQIRHSAATQHLKSILSNPLFSYSRQTCPSSPAVMPTMQRDPMDVFDHAVAKGMMTLKAATGCILAKRQTLSASGSASSSKTAPRVLRWLKATGAEADLRFLDDHAFVRALTPLLLAERLEGVAWEWLSRSLTEARPSWPDDLRVKRTAYLLARMVHTKSQPEHGNLDAAITAILHAEKSFHDSPLLPRCLVLPWRSVSWLSTVESFSRTAPSEELFDAHVATADALPLAFDVETAHLRLRHPTRPDHAPALRLFHDRDKLHRLVQRVSKGPLKHVKAKGMGVLPWLAFLGQDTVNHLTQSGHIQEADSITALLRSELDMYSPGVA